MTFEPHQLEAADLDGLRKHYKDLEILEIVFTVAGNNATNRWTEALGIPQEKTPGPLLSALGKSKADLRTFLTPTTPAWRERPSAVAPLRERKSGAAGPAMVAERPRLETRAEVEAALALAARRTPRLPLVEDSLARALLNDPPKESLPQWMRLLANFPKAGVVRLASLRAARDKGALSPRLRAQIDWIAARHDRAWYALADARRRLRALGMDDEAIFALDGEGKTFTAAERAAFAFVRQLTVEPASITDADVARLREHFKDAEVAELVYRISNAAFFNRLTEAAGLQVEQ
jgi:alkylhydroperoxidase family enzyme